MNILKRLQFTVFVNPNTGTLEKITSSYTVEAPDEFIKEGNNTLFTLDKLAPADTEVDQGHLDNAQDLASAIFDAVKQGNDVE